MESRDRIFLSKLLSQIETESCALGDYDYFVTLTSQVDSSKWIQLNGFQINCFYPYQSDPTNFAHDHDYQLPTAVELASWVPNSHVTYEYLGEVDHANTLHEDVAECIDFCVRKILQIDEPIAEMQLSEWK